MPCLALPCSAVQPLPCIASRCITLPCLALFSSLCVALRCFAVSPFLRFPDFVFVVETLFGVHVQLSYVCDTVFPFRNRLGSTIPRTFKKSKMFREPHQARFSDGGTRRGSFGLGASDRQPDLLDDIFVSGGKEGRGRAGGGAGGDGAKGEGRRGGGKRGEEATEREERGGSKGDGKGAMEGARGETKVRRKGSRRRRDTGRQTKHCHRNQTQSGGPASTIRRASQTQIQGNPKINYIKIVIFHCSEREPKNKK